MCVCVCVCVCVQRVRERKPFSIDLETNGIICIVATRGLWNLSRGISRRIEFEIFINGGRDIAHRPFIFVHYQSRCYNLEHNAHNVTNKRGYNLITAWNLVSLVWGNRKETLRYSTSVKKGNLLENHDRSDSVNKKTNVVD